MFDWYYTPLVREAEKKRIKLLRHHGGIIPKPRALSSKIPLLESNPMSVHHLRPFSLYAIKVQADDGMVWLSGIYSTRQAAQRVLELAKYKGSVWGAVYKDRIGFDSSETTYYISSAYLQLIVEDNHKLDHPTGEPVEQIKYHSRSKRLKIQTEDHQGYTGVFKQPEAAYKFRDLILASGNLEFYIESET
jgi:hypothetical protein